MRAFVVPLELIRDIESAYEAARPEMIERDASTPKAPDQALAAAIDKLPPAQRQLVVLFYFESLPVADVAVRLGKSEGAVKAGLYRAVRRLSKLVQQAETPSANRGALDIAAEVIERRRGLLARLAR